MLTEDDASDLYDTSMAKLRTRRDVGKLTERDDFLRAIDAEIDAGNPIKVTLKVSGERTVADPIALFSKHNKECELGLSPLIPH